MSRWVHKSLATTRTDCARMCRAVLEVRLATYLPGQKIQALQDLGREHVFEGEMVVFVNPEQVQKQVVTAPYATKHCNADS